MDSPGQGGGTATTAPVLAAFRKQVGWCDNNGAPFTARLLALLADDIAHGGPAAGLVGAWPGDPLADAVPLRLAGGLHALVLGGADPQLAACYPSRGDGDPGRLRSVLAAALAAHEGFLRGFVASPPQTNEVGRSAVLLGGFLRVAEATRLPLCLLEIGASAGLNLSWDRYRYQLGPESWGDPASPVRLAPEWHGPLPPLAAPLEIAERAGCDVAPVDLRQQESRLRLRAYVWADQPERLARLDAAIAVAREAGVLVERAGAEAWVPDRLATALPGQATVLYHSIMWQYMPGPCQAAVQDAIERAGARATQATPLAWLRLEPPQVEARPELRLTLWPGGHQHRLASAHPHGRTVRWLEAEA